MNVPRLPKSLIAGSLFFCSACAYAVDVSTASDLATALTTSSAGTTVTLVEDIDCSGWTTVDGFSGTLDGNGHKIKNLSATLFGEITGDIAISNLVVKDASIEVPGTTAPAAVLINSFKAANLAMENVTFTGSTLRNGKRNSNGVGFAVGACSVTAAASFKDCFVESGCSLAMGAGIHGGIVGRASATGAGATISFEHCCMASSISTTLGDGSTFGGIAAEGSRYCRQHEAIMRKREAKKKGKVE